MNQFEEEEDSSQTHSTTRFVSEGICRKLFSHKTMPGRGRRGQPLVEFVHSYIDTEFERLLELSVKVSKHILQEVGLSSLSHESSPHGPEDVDLGGKPIAELINRHFIDR